MLLKKSDDIKLCNFTLSAYVDDGKLADYEQSPVYISPEIVNSNPNRYLNSDIWFELFKLFY